MTESEELALYQTTTAWAYEFLLGIDQQLKNASGGNDKSTGTDSEDINS